MATHTYLLQRLAGAIDPAEPTPIYHQVAAVISFEIALGRVNIGSLLPPIRQVAALLGINYHTVRRGYDQLAAEGIVERRRGVGVRVTAAPRQTHWSPGGEAITAEKPHCWIVDHSLNRGAGLAVEITSHWSVNAGVWPAEETSPPPEGPILAPSSVAAWASEHWASRDPDLKSLDLALDGGTLAVIRRNAELLSVTRVALVGGEDEPALRQLRAQLPRVGLTVEKVEPDPDGDRLTVVAGEDWDQMSWEVRQHPRVMQLTWRLSPGSLARVAKTLGWKRA